MCNLETCTTIYDASIHLANLPNENEPDEPGLVRKQKILKFKVPPGPQTNPKSYASLQKKPLGAFAPRELVQSSLPV